MYIQGSFRHILVFFNIGPHCRLLIDYTIKRVQETYRATVHMQMHKRPRWHKD